MMYCRCVFVLLFLVASLPATAFGGKNGGGMAGSVVFTGEVPPPRILPVETDSEVCGDTVAVRDVLVNAQNKGIQYVVVSLESPKLKIAKVMAPKSLVFNAQCAFTPPVAAARKGDTIEVHNQDPILHNTHITMGKKTFLNVAQLPGSRPIPKTVKRKGIYEIQCDKHTFMTGTLVVFDHSFFTVTDERGNFQFPSLPPGHYQVSVWHSVLGTQTQDVLVPVGGMAKANFIFH